MPVVARTRQGDHALEAPGTLLSRCLAAGLPVACACSGRGACGRCIVTVLEGLALAPPSDRERAVLERNGAGQQQRLSCQCLPRHGSDLTVTTGYW